MTQNKFKKIAFFCTCGSSSGKVFEEMKKMSKTPVATLELKNKEEASKKIEDFCKKINEISLSL
jgi:flavodoxin